MSPSLRALLEHVIDYAGLFPPASLPLEVAVRNYDSYRRGPDAWMLGRFVCPAARLAELPPSQPLAVAALGRGGSDAAGFLDGVRQDLEDIAAFCAPPGRRQGHWWAVGVYETRLPAGADGRLLAAMARLIEADGPPEV